MPGLLVFGVAAIFGLLASDTIEQHNGKISINHTVVAQRTTVDGSKLNN